MWVIHQAGHPELKRMLYRIWFYFRTGCIQYFTFVLGLGNMLILTYYLAITNYPFINSLFPTFEIYALVSVSIGIPILCLAGYLHYKKSRAYSTDVEITVESNPYNYKLPPGITKECGIPFILELLILSKKNLDGKGFDESDLPRLKDLEKKLDLLSNGGSLPKPKEFSRI